MPVKTIRIQAHSVSSRVTIIDHSGSDKRSELAEKVLAFSRVFCYNTGCADLLVDLQSALQNTAKRPKPALAISSPL